MALDYTNLRSSLNKAGKYYILELTRELVRLDKRVTGELISSLAYSIVGSKDKLTLNITAAPYLGVVDKGRRKGAKPPPFKPILKWVQMRGIVFKDRKSGNPMSSNQTAYAIRYGISKNGIKPTNVLESTMKKFTNNLVIMNQITDGAKDIVNQLIQDNFADIRDNIKSTGSN